MNKSTQITAKTPPTADELKLRVLQAKAQLGPDFKLRAVYEYTFGAVSEKDFYKIQNCWLTKTSDDQITRNIEIIVENQKQFGL